MQFITSEGATHPPDPPKLPRGLSRCMLLLNLQLFLFLHIYTTPSQRIRLYLQHLPCWKENWFRWPISRSRSIWIRVSVNFHCLWNSRSQRKLNGPGWAEPAPDERPVLTANSVRGPGVTAFRSIGSFRKRRWEAIMRLTNASVSLSLFFCGMKVASIGVLNSCATLQWMFSCYFFSFEKKSRSLVAARQGDYQAWKKGRKMWRTTSMRTICEVKKIVIQNYPQQLKEI